MIRTVSEKQLFFRFAAVQVICYSMYAAFFPFLPALELSRGFSEASVSTFIAVYMLVSFIGQFFWSGICDRLRTNKKVLSLCVIACFALHLLLYFAATPVTVGICYALYGFFIGPVATVIDTWFLRSMNGNIGLYGKARSGGAISYGIVMLIMGFMIEKAGYIIMPILTTFFCALFISIVLCIPDIPASESALPRKSPGEVLRVLGKPAFLFLVLLAVLIGCAIAPINQLKIMALQTVGGDVSTQGLDGFLGCIAQFAMLYCISAMKKIPAKVRLLLSIGLYSAGQFITCLTLSLPVFLGGSLLIYATWGIFTPTMREVAHDSVAYEYQTTANAVCDSCFNTLPSVLVLPFTGALIQQYGIRPTLLGFAMLSLIPVGMAAANLFVKSRNTRKGI